MIAATRAIHEWDVPNSLSVLVAVLVNRLFFFRLWLLSEAWEGDTPFEPPIPRSGLLKKRYVTPYCGRWSLSLRRVWAPGLQWFDVANGTDLNHKTVSRPELPFPATTES